MTPSSSEPPNSRSRETALERREREYRTGWRMFGYGWELISQMLAGLLLGWGVDWFFETKPWGIVVGTCVGLLVGLVTFVRRTIRLSNSLGPVQSVKRRTVLRDVPPNDDESDSDDD